RAAEAGAFGTNFAPRPAPRWARDPSRRADRIVALRCPGPGARAQPARSPAVPSSVSKPHLEPFPHSMSSRLDRPVTLLIGDDDPSVRECVVELVAGRGFRILTAGSGLESLQILLRAPVDLSILDVHMPDMTGIEVFERFVRGPFIAAPDCAPELPRPRRLD